MNISCSFKIPVCLWLPCNWEWMERKCRTRSFLLLWERFFVKIHNTKVLPCPSWRRNPVCLLSVQLPCSSSFPKQLLEGRQRWENTRSWFFNFYFNLTSRTWTIQPYDNLQDSISWCHLTEETFIPLLHSSVLAKILCHFIQAILLLDVFPQKASTAPCKAVVKCSFSVDELRYFGRRFFSLGLGIQRTSGYLWWAKNCQKPPESNSVCPVMN